MLWTSRSEYSAACWLLRPGVRLEGPVCSEGVWHAVQPICLKVAWPAAMDCGEGLPGIPCVEGAGGLRKRMKLENSTTSLGIAAPEAAKLVSSSGVGL